MSLFPYGRIREAALDAALVAYTAAAVDASNKKKQRIVRTVVA